MDIERRSRNTAVLLWWTLLMWAVASTAQEAESSAPESSAPESSAPESSAPAPVLAIESISIEPAAPAADTLCQLRLQVKNSGEKTVSAFDFGVAIGGTPLKVYEQQLFLDALEPGKSAEIRLYNFWTSETGRPAPADGKLVLDVTLREAQWVEITTEDDGTEVWTLGQKVPGLPVSRQLTVKLRK